MEPSGQHTDQVEERFVAELAALGVNYLSRQSADPYPGVHRPYELMAGLVCQPSSRVRSALIALLLAHPDYTAHIPQALKLLDQRQAQTLRFFYTAAVNLQQIYAVELRTHAKTKWCDLPDLFSDKLGLVGNTPADRLRNLARLHALWSGENLNWAGTYERAAYNLLRRREREAKWKA